jgi:hypothetical protein
VEAVVVAEGVEGADEAAVVVEVEVAAGVVVVVAEVATTTDTSGPETMSTVSSVTRRLEHSNRAPPIALLIATASVYLYIFTPFSLSTQNDLHVYRCV